MLALEELVGERVLTTFYLLAFIHLLPTILLHTHRLTPQLPVFMIGLISIIPLCRIETDGFRIACRRLCVQLAR